MDGSAPIIPGGPDRMTGLPPGPRFGASMGLMNTRRALLCWPLALAALLSACGGGGGDGNAGTVTPQTCDDVPRKTALRDYFNDQYFWYRLSPRPDPAGTTSLPDYFNALLYTGTDPTFPADRWSYTTPTASYQQFFGDGRTLGYGVSVAGVEVTNRPDLPLYVRHVEPSSPAAAAGVVRGDRILTLNGRTAADAIAANDFSALTPAKAGDTLVLGLADAAGTRQVSIQAAVYDLVPVTNARVVTSPLGRKVGYMAVKDMISQALQPAADAIAGFAAQGVTEMVLDLRYNGGGLVTVGRDLASMLVGSRAAGQTYASLLFNDKHASSNSRYTFTNPGGSLGLQRVVVLAGERTCSASEQVIAGLRGVVDVVLVGRTSCGKPVGFVPHDDQCGNTNSVVNFESVNARNEGRYFDGLRPDCAATEDWSKPLGAVDEPFLAVALGKLDGKSCTAPATAGRAHALSVHQRRALANEGEHPAMIAD